MMELLTLDRSRHSVFYGSNPIIPNRRHDYTVIETIADKRNVARTAYKSLKRIMICGHGKAGKDTMSDWLADWTPLRHPGSTSVYLCDYVIAYRLGTTVEEARARPDIQQLRDQTYAVRHNEREEWKRVAHLSRDNDPLVFVREALANGDIICGIRDIREIHGARAENLVDIIVYVDAPVPEDPTVDFSPDDCDVVIRNFETIEAFYRRIRVFCNFGSIPIFTTPATGQSNRAVPLENRSSYCP